MRASAKVVVFGAVAVLSAAATPSQAGIATELAKQCRVMMIKAHPTQLFGEHGTAALQRDYFQECVTRQGKMDGGPERMATGLGNATTTGSGNAERGTTASGRRW